MEELEVITEEESEEMKISLEEEIATMGKGDEEDEQE